MRCSATCSTFSGLLTAQRAWPKLRLAGGHRLVALGLKQNAIFASAEEGTPMTTDDVLEQVHTIKKDLERRVRNVELRLRRLEAQRELRAARPSERNEPSAPK
jgi:hypothetical protein